MAWIDEHLKSWRDVTELLVATVASTWALLRYIPKILRVTVAFYESVTFLLDIRDQLHAIERKQDAGLAAASDNRSEQFEVRWATLDADSHTVWFESDEHGKTVRVNRTWEAWTGIPCDQARGAGWELGIAVEDRPRVLSNWQQAIDHQRNYEDTFAYTDRAGRRIEVQCSAKAIRRENGSIIKYFGSSQRPIVIPKPTITLAASDPRE